MRSLSNMLRSRGRGSIRLRDAVQVMLWIYCSAEVLPGPVPEAELTRAGLTYTFASLAAEGVFVFESGVLRGDPKLPATWDGAISRLLSDPGILEMDFVEAATYLR